MNESAAALQIQKLVRGHLARKRVLNLYKSTVKIQALIRGYLDRKHLESVQKHHKQIQQHEKKLNITRNRVVRREKELRTLKGIAGSRVADEEQKRIFKSAVIIQKWFRGWKARKIVGEMLRDKEEKEAAKSKKERNRLLKKARKRQMRSRGIEVDDSDSGGSGKEENYEPKFSWNRLFGSFPTSAVNEGNLDKARELVIHKLKEKARRRYHGVLYGGIQGSGKEQEIARGNAVRL
jgi:myosin heavy subunit